MRSRILSWTGLFLLLAAGTAAAQQRFIVRTTPDKARQIADRYGLIVLRAPDSHGIALLGANPALRSITATDPSKSLKADPDVGGLELDGDLVLPESPKLNQSTVAILDSLPKTRNSTVFFQDRVWDAYPKQWAADKIHVNEVQQYFAAIGAGVVAVIDTGIDARHITLASSMTAGYDFIRDTPGLPSDLADLNQSTVAILDESPSLDRRQVTAYVNQSTVAILDQSTVAILDTLRNTAPSFGHGTMVAGLVHLVAPNSKLMPLKAFSADGSGSLYDVIRAIYYAVDHGAKVINMSFSLDSDSEELQKALTYANAHRVICMSSAGNSGKAMMVYPAGYNTVGGIGSTNKYDFRSTFSNYGDKLVTLAAPGENLITTYPSQGWALVSGTSFSTALASGAAALMVQFNGNTNQAQAEQSLSHAFPVLFQGMGAGRLDLLLAVMSARWGH